MSGSAPCSGPWWAGQGFAALWELEPVTTTDLTGVRRQVALLEGVADACLVTDGQRGRPAVAGVVVAGVVEAAGATPVLCLNARDRNVLGARRDLLTAAAQGVQDVLLLRGDDAEGATRSDLTVGRLLAQARELGEQVPGAALRVGVTARVGRDVPRWKRDADFVVTQVSFTAAPLLDWRAGADLAMPVLAGVSVLASPGMARRMDDLPGVEVPAELLEALGAGPDAGVDAALALVEELRAGGLDGVHLVAGAGVGRAARRWRGR